jgi:hypothetical protein
MPFTLERMGDFFDPVGDGRAGGTAGGQTESGDGR